MPTTPGRMLCQGMCVVCGTGMDDGGERACEELGGRPPFLCRRRRQRKDFPARIMGGKSRNAEQNKNNGTNNPNPSSHNERAEFPASSSSASSSDKWFHPLPAPFAPSSRPCTQQQQRTTTTPRFKGEDGPPRLNTVGLIFHGG